VLLPRVSRYALNPGYGHCRKTGDDNGVLPPRDSFRSSRGYGCVAPVANHAAIFARSLLVMPVRLPIGIALVATTCP
jgi:hypothetical protein